MFDPNKKPDPDTCPKKFCSHWAKIGDRVDESGRTYDSFDKAIAGAKTIVRSARCACFLGSCKRDVVNNGELDRYEPDERMLKSAGLPWFYFISGKSSLAKEFWDEYDRETNELWGDG